jgi:hypothetical protein
VCFRLIEVVACTQSALDHVGERQEYLGPRGVREQGERDAGAAITDGLNSRCDELDRWGWSDSGVRRGEGRNQYRSSRRRGAGRPLHG